MSEDDKLSNLMGRFDRALVKISTASGAESETELALKQEVEDLTQQLDKTMEQVNALQAEVDAKPEAELPANIDEMIEENTKEVRRRNQVLKRKLDGSRGQIESLKTKYSELTQQRETDLAEVEAVMSKIEPLLKD